MAEVGPPPNDYRQRLEKALQAREEYLSSDLLPNLKEEYRKLHSALTSLLNVFTQKGLIHEDPYKYDRKISEITVPSSDPMTETEQPDEIGLRLSQYETQLDFLENYYQFSIDFLTLKRIKLLANLAKYIDWHALLPTSARTNTRAVAELSEKVRGGSDAFSAKIVADAQRQMAEAVRKILAMLRELTDYHRESYKLRVRVDVLSGMQLPQSIGLNEVESMLIKLRRRFAQSSDDSLPFYNDLVREVIIEDCTAEGGSRREATLKKLAVPEKKQEKETTESLKPVLLEGVRVLATASRHLESALRKLQANAEFYESRRSTGGWLRRWLQSLVGGKQKKIGRIYEVEFVDVATSVSRHEKIDFDRFVVDAARYAKLLASYSSRGSDRYTQLEQADEKAIYETFENLIVELQRKVKTIPALQEFFVSEVPREVREKLAGVKLEINAIKNPLARANQRRHDYVARKEEEEQLARLGFGKGQVPSE